MIGSIFNTVLHEPFYNGFVFLISIVPFHDVGLAVIALTALVRVALIPVMHKSTVAQRRMKELEPVMKEIKEETKEDKQEQSRQIMALYQKHGINPFSGCLLFIIQIPVILTLFWVFHKNLGNGLTTEGLYSFVTLPDIIQMKFLGLIDMGERSLLLAVLAGATQFFQMKFAIPKAAPRKKDEKPSFKDELSRSMQTQMKYGFPLFAFFLAYTTFSSAVALYWTTSNIISIGHELFVRRQGKKTTETST